VFVTPFLGKFGNDAQENTMIRRISLPIAGVFAAVISCVAPGLARADMEVYFQEDNGPLVQFVGHTAAANDFKPAGNIGFSGNFGDFQITFFGSTAQNLNTASDLMTSTTSVINNDAAKNHKLTIYVSQSNYTKPPGPVLQLTSHIGGSVTTAGAGQSITFQSYANATNADLASPVSAGDGAVTAATLAAAVASATGYPGQPGQPLTPGTQATTGPQVVNVSSAPSSFDSKPDPSTIFNDTAGIYSVTTINAITLAANGNLNFSSTTTLTAPTAVPAPAGLVLALTAMPALGFGGWLSRRRKAAR
jgi:hypothetical protein